MATRKTVKRSPKPGTARGRQTATSKELRAIREAKAGDSSTLKSDVRELKETQATMSGDINTLKADVHTIKADVHTIKGGRSHY